MEKMTLPFRVCLVELLKVQSQGSRAVGPDVSADSNKGVRLFVKQVLEGDDNALEVLRPLLDVVANFFHIHVV